MTNEKLISFITNAIREQELPYEIVATDTGFLLQLAMDKQEYIEENEVPEAFFMEVKLTEDKGRKFAEVTKEVYLIEKHEDLWVKTHKIELEDIKGFDDNSDQAKQDDFWKLYKAERWLASIIAHHKFAVKKTAVEKSRPVVLIAVLLIVGFIIALGLASVGGQMFSGFSKVDEIQVELEDDEKQTPEEVLSGFYK